MGIKDLGGLLTHKGLLSNKLTGKWLQIGVCVTGSSGFLLLGYDRESDQRL